MMVGVLESAFPKALLMSFCLQFQQCIGFVCEHHLNRNIIIVTH